MVMQNLVSDRIKKKAETIIVIKEDESDSKIYFKAIWSAPNGKHEYKISYNKRNDVSFLDRWNCTCAFHSLNVEDFHFCAYSYAVFEWLCGAGILRDELLCENEVIL